MQRGDVLRKLVGFDDIKTGVRALGEPDTRSACALYSAPDKHSTLRSGTGTPSARISNRCGATTRVLYFMNDHQLEPISVSVLAMVLADTTFRMKRSAPLRSAITCSRDINSSIKSNGNDSSAANARCNTNNA